MTDKNEEKSNVDDATEGGVIGPFVLESRESDANNTKLDSRIEQPVDVSMAQPLAAHTRLGSYEIIECIDKGGMGVVYRARHTALGKIVALKVVSARLRFEPRAIKRFLREMQAIGRLAAHPNVLNAYDAGEVDGVQFIATEFVEGVQLGSLVKRVGPLTFSEACKIISQAALALDHLRTHKLVHRDIKPSNLMLTRDGVVKVVDMGLALLRDEQEQQITSFGETMGSIDYMAPEQWEDSHNVDWRSDIYSLGCTFYCLLAGNAPYSEHRGGSIAKLKAHLDEDFPDIRKKRSDVPDQAADLISAMVTKDPDARLTDLVKLSAQLSEIASGDLRGLVQRSFVHGSNAKGPAHEAGRFPHVGRSEDFSSPDPDADTRSAMNFNPSPPEDAPSPKSPIRNRALVLLAMATVVGISAITYFQPPGIQVTKVNQLLTTGPGNSIADLGTLPDLAGQTEFDARVESTTAIQGEPISLVGNQSNVMGIAFLSVPNQIASISKKGKLSIFDLSEPQKPIHSVRIEDESLHCFAYDSSAEQIVVGGADGVLHFHAAQDGREIRLAGQQRPGYTCVVPIPDSQEFASADWSGTIRRFGLTGNQLIANCGDPVFALSISPDGAWMAWAGRGQMVTLLDTDSEEQRLLSGHLEWAHDVAFSPDGKRLASAGHEGVVHIWQIPSGEPEHSIECLVPQTLCFFPDCRHLAIGGRDSVVHIWDLELNQSVLEIPVQNHIDSLAISADGKQLAIGDNAGSLTVWPISVSTLPSS